MIEYWPLTRALRPHGTAGCSVRLGTLIALLALTGWAQEAVPDSADSAVQQQDEYVELERMVVTATRTKRRLSEIPASVSVIDAKEIASSGALSIGDALTHEAGVIMKRPLGMGEGLPADINIRGVPGAFAAARVLILIDGIPVNVSGAPFLFINQIPMQAIERVEVVRGPFSCLYGANAFGGVVNIITKEGTGSPRVDLEGAFGSYLLYQAGLWSGGGNSKINYSVNLDAQGTGNILARSHAVESHFDSLRVKDTANHDFRAYRFVGKFRWWAGEKTTVELQTRYFQSDQGFGMTKSDTLHNPTDSIPNDIDMFGRKIMVGPSISLDISEQMKLRFSGYVRRLVGEFYNEALSNVATRTDTDMVLGVPVARTTYVRDSTRFEESYWKSISDDGQLGIQTNYRLGQHHSVVAGAEYLTNRINFGHTVSRETGEPLLGSTRRKETIHNGAVYLQDEIRLFDRLNLVPGIRSDYHSLFGGVVSPKLGASLQITDWLGARTSGGRAFRAPTLSELYLPPLELQPGIKLLPNPHLKPEYIVAGDAGVDLSIAHMLFARISGFYNRMDDLITPAISSSIVEFLDEEQVTITHRTVSEAWSAGLEAELELKYRQWLRVKLGYAFTESADEETGEPLDYIPRHKGSALLRLGLPLGPLRASGWLAVDVVGPRGYLDWQAPAELWDVAENWDHLENARPNRVSLDSYTKVDLSLKLAYRTLVWAGVGIQNLTDVEYMESGGILAPGRMIWLRLGGEFPAR